MKKSLLFVITFFTALGFVGYNSVLGMVPTENSSDDSSSLVVKEEEGDKKSVKPKTDLGRMLSSTFANHEELKRQFLYLLLFQIIGVQVS